MAKGKPRRSNKKPFYKKDLNKHDSTKDMRRDSEIAGSAAKEFAADSRDRRDCYRSKENDPAWYAQNPQLLNDYASYPFGKAVGSRINWGVDTSGATGADSPLYQLQGATIPGILAYYFEPAIGQATDANAPINVAARNIYSYVRHANSGHANYEAPDLMMYLLAMDSVYMYHSFMKRVAGLVLDYSTLNRYYPRAIVQAMGVDFDDISMHIQDFRGFINQYAVKMGSMCVPNSMSYMARHTWMCEGIYTDSTTAKAQTYFYSPQSFYQFMVDQNTGVGYLRHNQFTNPTAPGGVTGSLKSYQQMVEFGNDLLNTVLQQEDFNIMSGDILKAFGVDGVVKVSGIAEGYMILPTYNQEVLSQMENATVLRGYYGGAVNQNTSIGGGFLTTGNSPFIYNLDIVDPTVLPTGATAIQLAQIFAPLTINKLLNFHHSDPTPADVMVATRLSNIITPPTSISGQLGAFGNGVQIAVGIPTLGSEVISNAKTFAFTYAANGTLNLIEYAVPTLFPVLSYSTSVLTMSNMMPRWVGLERLSTFDWHHAVFPVGYSVSEAGFPNIFKATGAFMDIDNYTSIDAANLENMTTAALLSQFSVPQMGAFSSKL